MRNLSAMRYPILLLALLCVSCGTALPSIKPYKLDVQQGNVVTSKMLLQLRPGMTQSQVRFIMGTPLIQDSFHGKRWDYVYQMRENGKITEQRRVILDFENDLLKTVRGDVIPAAGDASKSNEVADNTGTRVINPSAKAEDKSLISKLKFWEKAAPDPAPQAKPEDAAKPAVTPAVATEAKSSESQPSESKPSESKPLEAAAAPAPATPEPQSVLAVPLLPAEASPVAATEAPATLAPSVEASPAAANTVAAPPVAEQATALEPPAAVEPAAVPPVAAEATPLEASSVEASNVEASSVEASSVEASSVEASSVEASSVEASSVEASSVEASSVEASSVEASSAEPLAVPATTPVYDSPSGMQFERNLTQLPQDAAPPTVPEPAPVVSKPAAASSEPPKAKELPVTAKPSFFDRMLEKIGF